MATVRISQLTAITAPTDDDVLIINDADTNTRKITFANLTQNLVNTTAAAQTKSGALTVTGTLTAGANFVVDTNTFFVDSVTNRCGVRTISPNTELDIDGTVHIRNSNTLQFGDANDSNYVSLGAPSVIASNFALTLPASLPAANNILWSDGSGNLGYTTGVTYDSGTQALTLGQAYFTNRGSVRFYEQSINGSEYVGFTAPANLASTTGYTLPGTYPASNGFVLASTTGGVLSWVSNGAGAAGSAGDVQFSDGAQLTSNSNFNFNNGTQTLNVPSVVVGSVFESNGSSQLGNSSGDDLIINASLTTDFKPKTTGTVDLGTSILHFAEAHVDDLYVYGNAELGNGSGDLISINGAVDTNVLPDVTVTRNLGSSTVRWNSVFANGLDFIGDATFGDTSGDLITINGDIAGRLIPRADGAIDLGSATRRFANAHINQLSTYGTTTLGDTNADSVVINGVVQSNVLPSGGFDLGAAGSRWANVYATAVDATSVNTSGSATVGAALTFSSIKMSGAIAGPLLAAAAANFQLEDITTHRAYSVSVFARDTTTNATELFDYLIASDGTVISGQAGTTVRSGVASALVTPSVSIVTVGAANFARLTLTNTAVSTNSVSVRIVVTAVPNF
jgi:hypothetical protein